jgi:short-subunit dehydrogenase
MNPLPPTFLLRYGPWALVTGASDGIGRAFARELAAAGFNLVLVARREDRLQALANELRAARGTQNVVLALDLADRDAHATLAAATETLDIGLLVAAAGYGTAGPFLNGDTDTDSNLVDVNCSAVLRQCHTLGQRFAARGRGGVILLSSVVAFQGTPYSANYAASKAYIQTLAEALHHEWQALGIDVIASAPGPIDSGFATRANMRMARSMTPDVVASATLRALGRRATVRPGWLSRLLGWSLATAPRPLRVRIIGGIMRGMTAHQDAAGN